jgi:hypothetical protein
MSPKQPINNTLPNPELRHVGVFRPFGLPRTLRW